MNNLLSYFELVDAKIRASVKDLPVKKNVFLENICGMHHTYQQIKAELQLLTSLFFFSILFLALLTSGSSVLWQLFLNPCVKCLAI